ncbi:cellulose-binding protein [Sphaerisporangium krabiense]|uniref:Chitin-binding protein n=1 Tax=Sphaerisporangium krabiense TaxID=763782 RepID=A0A7W8Z991_9ACTN|nr:lytic polysaccharide monooxygenase [Sphaerisporangium krabiense]MBB5629847.1 chitin-binding protein [Sphaerisporangium krabiense]GII63948.1 cellulose-binding protein [Sphaerisporangium krabiense]
MRRAITYLMAMVIAASTVVFVATPAEAHGYIISPPSRQANCAQRKVSNCGDIIYEPQSVEGPKGQRNCSAGDSRWSPLDDDSKAWPVASVSDTVSFRWTLPVAHATRDWEYYVGNTRLAVFSGGGREPASSVTHSVSLGGRTGRIKLLAIWNIADTEMAFYSCVDLQVGPGGPDPTPTPTPTVTPTRTPTPTPTPTVTPNPGGAWTAGTAYTTGTVVTYNGASYRCLQPHTALPGWEPPNVPALWARV